jgi:DNA-binding response OmpR family regulator
MMTPQILIVEDDIVFCKMLTKFLSRNGFSTLDAQSAEKAMELLGEHNPDLAILDYRLPGLNGLELLKWIKANHPEIKVIMVSRVDDQAIAEQALNNGAEDFITKPINPADLLEKLKKSYSLK